MNIDLSDENVLQTSALFGSQIADEGWSFAPSRIGGRGPGGFEGCIGDMFRLVFFVVALVDFRRWFCASSFGSRSTER